MNKKIYHPALYFAITLLISCSSGLFGKTGKGTIISENRIVSNFQSIELQTDADVEITIGDAFKVEVSDYENIIMYTSVEVLNQKLVISRKPYTTVLINSKAKVKITMPDKLSSAVITGSGDIILKSPFNKLEILKITGSGDIVANENLDLITLNASISGSGNITAKGNVENLTASISGSGNLIFSNLIAKAAKCTITGSGNISIYANNTLDVHITGSGNITYYGNPSVDSSISGSGNVIHK